MLEVEFTPRALLDLDGIAVCLGVEVANPAAARGAIEKILQTMDLLAQTPSLGRLLEDEVLDRSYRRFLAGSYWIYYTYDSEKLTVWRIYHTSRDTDSFGYISPGE